jgi:hypothetical protein
MVFERIMCPSEWITMWVVSGSQRIKKFRYSPDPQNRTPRFSDPNMEPWRWMSEREPQGESMHRKAWSQAS